MTSNSHISPLARPFAIGLVPLIGVQVLLLVFDPATVFGVSATTAIGAVMTIGMGWCVVVSLAYSAPWTAAGFSVMTVTFGYQVLSGWAIRSPFVSFVVVSGACLLFFVGDVRDIPTAPWQPISSR